MRARRLVLIGARGSGKSVCGQGAATKLGVGFVDLDVRTAAAMGFDSAGEALARCGEQAFRQAESRALAAALGEPAAGVISLGGGTPMAPGADQLLAGLLDTRIVYLRATPQTLGRRLERDPTPRPALTPAGTLGEIETVLAARDPVYRRVATHVLDVDELRIDQVVDALAEIAVTPSAPRPPHAPPGRSPGSAQHP